MEHDQLEGDRIDHIRREGNRGVLTDRVRDEDADRRARIRDEVDAKRSPDPKTPSQSALQRVHRPDGEGQDDEENGIGMRAGLVEEDGLGRAEGRVHGPADDHREPRDLQRAAELGPAYVQDLGEQRRDRLSLQRSRPAGRSQSSARRRCVRRSADACRRAG